MGGLHRVMGEGGFSSTHGLARRRRRNSNLLACCEVEAHRYLSGARGNAAAFKEKMHREAGMDEKDSVFQQLREIILRAAPLMVVAKDIPGQVELHAPWRSPRKPKEPVWFGMVKIGKAYVSYHLMPLYTEADLAASVPDPLRRRMQGKTCFNFKSSDEDRFAELEDLTSRCARAYAQPPCGGTA
jgi:hypothetical protein